MNSQRYGAAVTCMTWERRRAGCGVAQTGRLTPFEYELIKHHAVIGERLCNLRSLAAIAR